MNVVQRVMLLFPALRTPGITAEQYRKSKQDLGLPVKSCDGWLRNFYFDTSGPGWAVQRHGMDGYRGLHVLEDGDHLTVYTRWGFILWQGVIDFEYESGFVPYPGIQGGGVQLVWNQCVNGCQRGVPLEQWAEMFMGPQCIPRRNLHGTLTWVPSQSQVLSKE